jgi:DNA polymerase
MTDKMGRLKSLRAECYACKKCDLYKNDPPCEIKPHGPHVFGSGWINSPILLVGQNPGLNEVSACKPFIGKAGDKLNSAIVEAGLSRDRFYVTNGVLCYTTGNAAPEDQHITPCSYYLSELIDILQPKLVVAMGGSACKSFDLPEPYSISLCKQIRTQKCELHNQVLATCHPSYCNYNKDGYPILVNTFNYIRASGYF